MAYEELQRMVDESERIVFFGGAGVSTESGIPDFRSVDGLYHQKYDYPPETILSHTFFMKKPEAFFKFYRDKMLPLDAKPNKAHLKLAEWEKAGPFAAAGAEYHIAETYFAEGNRAKTMEVLKSLVDRRLDTRKRGKVDWAVKDVKTQRKKI